MVKGMAFFWLAAGVISLCCGLANSRSQAVLDFQIGMAELAGGGLFTVIPLGVLLRKRWGYYGGRGLSALMMLGFPLGTILGLMSMKAYADSRHHFGLPKAGRGAGPEAGGAGDGLPGRG